MVHVIATTTTKHYYEKVHAANGTHQSVVNNKIV